MMERTRLALLVDRAVAKTISPEEREELLSLITDSTHKAEAEKLLTQAWDAFKTTQPVFEEHHAANMLQAILEPAPARQNKQREMRPIYKVWIKIAASVILVSVAATGYYYYQRTQGQQAFSETTDQHRIQPGGDKAILTMGNGRTILLDDAANGLLAAEGGVDINKKAGGQLLYHSDGQASMEKIYHTITIPKGGQYKVVLPDGTNVYLNSASSLRYPVQFSGKHREVELTGEGYFDVASVSSAGKKIPFVVRTPTQTVEVLGTVFNIHAYSESIGVKTTLLEGRVRVHNETGESILLKPGEAAINDFGSNHLHVTVANVDQDVAWQRGYFVFENEGIESIMTRVARWYDVRVTYEGDMEGRRFGGIFQRSKDIVQLLENFKETGLIDYKIAERRIVIMAK